METMTWRQRKGWLRWIGRPAWDTGITDFYGRPVRVCTRCGCSFVFAQCPSQMCDPDWPARCMNGRGQ